MVAHSKCWLRQPMNTNAESIRRFEGLSYSLSYLCAVFFFPSCKETSIWYIEISNRNFSSRATLCFRYTHNGWKVFLVGRHLLRSSNVKNILTVVVACVCTRGVEVRYIQCAAFTHTSRNWTATRPAKTVCVCIRFLATVVISMWKKKKKSTEKQASKAKLMWTSRSKKKAHYVCVYEIVALSVYFYNYTGAHTDRESS